MNFVCMSDLHLEFHEDGGDAFFSELSREYEILILAGDICSESMFEEVFPRFCQHAKHVIYVLGNHEFFTASKTEVYRKLEKLNQDLQNFHWLNRSEVMIDGQRFLGAVLWYIDTAQNSLYGPKVGDFKFIEELVPWVYEENAKDQKWLHETMNQNDIVITHFMPSHMSISPHFIGSPLNRFFVCNMEEAILEKQPKIWIHGHTHDTCNYFIKNTRVFCNPYGYPHSLNPLFSFAIRGLYCNARG